MLVGTHALVAKPLDWKALALVMIDEQHRFGVEQRLTLREAARQSTGFDPHTLAMTATPIPRTLSMTVWGDLEVSVINCRPDANRFTRAHFGRFNWPVRSEDAVLWCSRWFVSSLTPAYEQSLRQSPLARFGAAFAWSDASRGQAGEDAAKGACACW